MANAIQVFKFDVVQVLRDDKWLDYATVKDAQDVAGINDNIRWLKRNVFRIERYQDRSVIDITRDTWFEFAGER
jgi:hypothetical protein